MNYHNSQRNLLHSSTGTTTQVTFLSSSIFRCQEETENKIWIFQTYGVGIACPDFKLVPTILSTTKPGCLMKIAELYIYL